MELTLASALSPDSILGHLGYLLLVVSMLMRVMFWLRVFVLISSFSTIAYATFVLTDPVALFWETTLIVVNTVQLTILKFHDLRARFTTEEKAFADLRLRGLTPGERRRILDMGTWRDLPPGTPLTREGERPEALTFVASGRVGIHAGGRRVADCGPGRYVGEMSILDRGPASADAICEEPTRVWQIPVSTLDRLHERKPAQSAVIEAGIARDMRRKILSLNNGPAPA